jgi:hypothetical protein
MKNYGKMLTAGGRENLRSIKNQRALTNALRAHEKRFGRLTYCFTDRSQNLPSAEAIFKVGL